MYLMQCSGSESTTVQWQ